MGGFFIVGAHARAHAAALDASFRAQGFAPARRIEHVAGDVWLYPRQTGGGAEVADLGAGRFAALTGTLLYRGRGGAPAIGDLGRDVLAGAIAWDDLHGSFALIVGAGAGLVVMTDPAGTCFVHRAAGGAVLSSSFLAAAACLTRPELEAQSVYEYVFAGSVFGGRTLLREVDLLDCGAATGVGRPDVALPVTPRPVLQVSPRPLAECVEACHGALRPVFRAIAATYGDRVDAALSGGYDSRLILALLLEQGVTPRLHVYGTADDADVRVARAVAEGEGLPLRHIDKRTLAPAGGDLAEVVARNHHAFDGCPTDGIFDDGADLASRLQTFAGGALALNGGGGEVMRNFINLPDAPYSVAGFLRSFYRQYDPAVTTPPFSERAYQGALADKVRQTLGIDRDRLTRTEIEYLYPAFRGRFWMGRNNGVNLRLGAYATPFVDQTVAAAALGVPLAVKNGGRLEAAILRRAWPGLARYASSYGHDFAAGPPLRRRLGDALTRARPTLVRGLSYRLQHRLRGPLAPPLGQGAIARLMDPTLPITGRFFRVDRLRDGTQLRRVWTLEYLCQRIGALVPPPFR